MRPKMATNRELGLLFDEMHYSTSNSVVSMVEWSPEKIENYQFVKNTEYLPQKNKFEPAVKKRKLNEEEKLNILKLVLSGDGEPYTSKPQLKITTNNMENRVIYSEESGTEEYHNNNDEIKNNTDMDCTLTPIESAAEHMDFSNEHAKNTNMNCTLTSIESTAEHMNFSNEHAKNTDMNFILTPIESTAEHMDFSNEHAKNTDMNCTLTPIEIAAEHMDFNNEHAKNTDMNFTLASIESAAEHMDFSNERTKVITSTDLSKIGKIKVRCISEMSKPHLLQHQNTEKVKINSTNIIPVHPVSRVIKTKKIFSLSEIESLYQKYFNKVVLDTIVVIANIMKIFSTSNKHHRERMNNSYKRISGLEKKREQQEAKSIHSKNIIILNSELKNLFSNVITGFAIPEFELAFLMFILGILFILKRLFGPHYKSNDVLKYLVESLQKCLKNSKFDYDKVFAMLKSNTFCPDINNLENLIVRSPKRDPGITDRMPLFFLSSVNGQEYFQEVVDVVTGKSNCNLQLLLDNAVIRNNINSNFQYSTHLHSSSTVKSTVNLKVPATVTQSALKSNDSIQQRKIIEKPNKTLQPTVPTLKLTLQDYKCTTATTTSTTNTVTSPGASTSYSGNKDFIDIRSTTNQLQVVNKSQDNMVKTPRLRIRTPKEISNECFSKNC